MNILESNDYIIYFDASLQALQNFVAQHKYVQLVVLVDENTQKYCLPVLKELLPQFPKFECMVMPSGEQYKTIETAMDLWRQLLELGIERNALMINLGGGVVTDMGGFVASTYKRGIDFVHIPTTLLAQVDASVGGKTGIDFQHMKNIIGTYTQPQAVFIHDGFLKTLAHKQVISGFAEMLKHGIIADATYYNSLVKIADVSSVNATTIQQSIKIKNDIVQADPQEKGLRKILNFGHTIGHAIESWSLAYGEEMLLHGAAIAIGMIAEVYLAHKQGLIAAEDVATITQNTMRYFSYYDIPNEIDATLLQMMQHDKKNIGGTIRFSLPTSIGACSYNVSVPEEWILESLQYYRNLKP